MTYIIDSYQKIRVDLRDLFRTEDEQINKEKQADITNLRKIISEHQSGLEKTLLTTEGKKIFQDFSSRLELIIKYLIRWLNLVLQTKMLKVMR